MEGRPFGASAFDTGFAAVQPHHIVHDGESQPWLAASGCRRSCEIVLAVAALLVWRDIEVALFG